MLVRITSFASRPDVAPERVESFRRWLSEQPGFVQGWHVTDPQTGEHVSVSVWTDRESLAALRERVPPGGRMGLSPDRCVTYEVEAHMVASAAPTPQVLAG